MSRRLWDSTRACPAIHWLLKKKKKIPMVFGLRGVEMKLGKRRKEEEEVS